MLKLTTLSSVTGLAAVLLFTSHVSAVYTGLTVSKYTTLTVDGVNRDVWRIYANFTNPNDRLLAGSGLNTPNSLVLESRNAADNGPGSPFYNAIGGTNRPPTQADIDGSPSLQWDSFVTIGISIADQAPYGDQMFFSPGFPNLAGTTYSAQNAGWLCVPTIDEDGNPATPEISNPQTQAGFLGDGDPLLRVLMAQLTTDAGGNVRGTVAVTAWDAGAGSGYTLGGQTFNSVPMPPGLALLGFAALGRRRRKR